MVQHPFLYHHAGAVRAVRACVPVTLAKQLVEQEEETRRRLVREVAYDLQRRVKQELAFPAVIHFYSWLLQGKLCSLTADNLNARTKNAGKHTPAHLKCRNCCLSVSATNRKQKLLMQARSCALEDLVKAADKSLVC